MKKVAYVDGYCWDRSEFADAFGDIRYVQRLLGGNTGSMMDCDGILDNTQMSADMILTIIGVYARETNEGNIF